MVYTLTPSAQQTAKELVGSLATEALTAAVQATNLSLPLLL